MRITTSLLLTISLSMPAFGQDIEPVPEIDPPPELPTDGDGVERDNGIRNEGDLNTNQIGSNNNNRTTNNSGPNAGSTMPANTAVSPSLMSSGSESCLQSISGGLQLVGIGVSSGKYIQDEECNRRRNAITLSNMGLKIGAVSLMCQNPNVWRAMLMAATPCPVVKYGKIIVGKRAMLEIKQRPELLIPDYLDDKDFYDAILGMGVETDEAEVPTSSLSERYRTSSGE
jgi:hypothetical protein